MSKKHVKDYVADTSVEGGYRYIGAYYVDSVKPEERKKTGWIHLVAGILEIVLVFWAASINCAGTRTIYVVIPLECTLFCALLYVMGAYRYLKNGNRMERKDYEGSYLRMVQSVTIAFFLNIGSAIGQIILICRGINYAGMAYEYLLLSAIVLMGIINCIGWVLQRRMFAKVVQQ